MLSLYTPHRACPYPPQSCTVPYDSVQCSCKQDEHFRVEEGEVVEAILPPNNGCYHEQPGTTTNHQGDKRDDLGVGGGGRIRGEGEL